MADDMEEIIQDFLIETQEILDGLDQKFVELEKDRDNQKLLNDIFRSIHTIKGASGFLGFSQLVEVTHGTESILKRLKDGQMKATPVIMDEILHAVDMMKILVGHVRDKDSVEEDISGIAKKLEDIIQNQPDPAGYGPGQETRSCPLGITGSPDLNFAKDKLEQAQPSHPLGSIESPYSDREIPPIDQELLVSHHAGATGTTKHENPPPPCPSHQGRGVQGATLSLLPLEGGGQGRGDESCFRTNDSCPPVRAPRSMKITPLLSPLNLRGDEGGLPKEEGGGLKGNFQVNVEEPVQPLMDSDGMFDQGQETIEQDIKTCRTAQHFTEEPEEVRFSTNNLRPAQEAAIPALQTEKAVQTEQTIRVDVQRLDGVLNLVGELVLGRNRLMRIASNLEITHSDEPEVAALAEACAFINLITTDLQIAVMKTRMQPVKKVFNRFPRMVRDLARAKGKEVELQVFGEETELDKSVIEEIGDPLVHLIRNALDHGIESPAERKMAGKPGAGFIRLSASQEGNNILLKIEDDGKGIDPDILRIKALEKGFMSASDVEKLSDKDALDLIFMPGFSTAKEISDISGRGVGMDVVKTNVSRLNGHIDIKTQQARGTEFVIRLPLTLAIIQALMVKIGPEIFAIPLSIVVETVRVSQSELKTIDSQEAIVLRGQVLSLIRFGREFHIISPNGNDKVYVVIVALGEKKFGIIVDQLLGQEEVVIKSIEGKYGTFEGIAGATITGDGRVVLILDVARIMDTLLKNSVA